MVRYDHLRTVGLIVLLAQPAAAQDATRGLEVMRDSERGNCSICHIIPGIGLPDEAQGNIGPSLAGVAGRLTPAEIHQRLVDARVLNPATMMPPYGTTAGLADVARPYRDRTILTPDEIADVSAYLATLE